MYARLITIIVSIFIFTACSSDRKNSFRITSVKPNVNQTNVTPEISVSANFTLDVDENSFVNTTADIGSILDRLPNYQTYALFEKADGAILWEKGVQAKAGLTIQQLLDKNYALTYDTASQGEDAERYRELNNFALFRDIEGSEEVFVFSATIIVTGVDIEIFKQKTSELEGVFLGQNTFTVSELTDSGPQSVGGKLTVEGKTVSFKPDLLLRWQTKYSVSIKKSVTSVDGKNISDDYNWTFETEPKPDPEK